MSATSNSRLVTAEQLARFPDDGYRRELVHGVVLMMSPAGGRHGQVALLVAQSLVNHVRQRDLGIVFAAETGFLLARSPDTVLAPDVAFVRKERLVHLTDMNGYLPLAPDLVGEVISPSDRFTEVEEKAWFWINSGVRAVLVLDPVANTVRIYKAPNQMLFFEGPDELAIEDVVPAWRVKTAELFA